METCLSFPPDSEIPFREILLCQLDDLIDLLKNIIDNAENGADNDDEYLAVDGQIHKLKSIVENLC